MRTKIWFFIFVLSLISATIFTDTDEIKSAEIPFKKIVRENDREIDNVEGIIYFTGEERIFVRVTKPINQIVIFSKFTNTFYYPDEKSAIIMTFDMPNISATKMQFDVFARDDMGLGEAGYNIEKTFKSNNIIVTVWTPPEKFKKQLGKIEIGQDKSGIKYNKIFSPKDELFAITEFIEFTKIKGKKIPLHIKTTTFYDKKKREEELIYSSPKIDANIAEDIAKFKLPDDTKIKTMEW